MLDTLTIAHRLTDAGLPAAHADAIAGAVREAADAGGAVTPEMLRGEIATVRTEIATVRTEIATEIGAVRADLYRVAAGQTIATIVAVGVMLRLIG